VTRDSSNALHLFSSNYRPLYVQDCLDLLAKPSGAPHRFRYQERWVWAPANKVEKEDSVQGKIRRWRQLEKSTEVIVYFAWVKDLPEGEETVYIPLRRGTLLKADVEEESYFFIEFQLGDYIDPANFMGSPIKSNLDAPAREWIPRLRDITGRVRDLLGDKFPSGTYGGTKHEHGYSAVLARAPQVGHGGTSGSAFDHAAEALGEVLSREKAVDAYAEVFIKALRVRRLRHSGHPALLSTAHFGKPSLELRGGNLYEIDFLVIRTSECSEPVTVSIDPSQGCTIISHASHVLTSKYDIATFRFFVEARDNPTVGEMTVRAARATSDDAAGVPFMPQARFQLRLKPRRFLTVSAYIAALLTALATFLVALVGQKGIYLGTSNNSIPSDGVLDLSGVAGWLGGGALAVSVTALAVAGLTSVSAGGAALLLLIRRRFGLSA
jgi:hypothetical protein